MDAGAWAVCVLAWCQAAVGTGLLASVPGTMLLLVYMGGLAAQRGRFRLSSPSESGWEPARVLTPADRNA
jgi:hypothetical protein